MCDVWANSSGMQTDAFFSSDASTAGEPRNFDAQSDAEVDSDDARSQPRAEEEEGSNCDEGTGHDRRQGWRADRPSKRRKAVTLAEGMMAVHDSMKDIAEAFKTSRAASAETTRPDASLEILQWLKELTESVRAQTDLLLQLVQQRSAANEAD
jgi:hypothetical protein